MYSKTKFKGTHTRMHVFLLLVWSPIYATTWYHNTLKASCPWFLASLEQLGTTTHLRFHAPGFSLRSNILVPQHTYGFMPLVSRFARTTWYHNTLTASCPWFLASLEHLGTTTHLRIQAPGFSLGSSRALRFSFMPLVSSFARTTWHHNTLTASCPWFLASLEHLGTTTHLRLHAPGFSLRSNILVPKYTYGPGMN